MRIIPAIDIINGKCVRLTKGDYTSSKVYFENPLDVAKMFEDAGLRYLHLVDLDGAKSSRVVNYSVLKEIVKNTSLIVDFGGGIKTEDDLIKVFECGAQQVSVGSLAIKQPETFFKWLDKYGSEKIMLSADAIDGKIAIQGWQSITEKNVEEIILEYCNRGVKYVVCTDISKDGMLTGAAYELYERILNMCKVNLIASGGVSSIEDIIKLKNIGCEAVIIGKAIYEGKIKLEELVKVN